MIKGIGEVGTYVTSFIGVYYIIQSLWELSEEAQFGEYVVSKADSVACFVLSLIVVVILILCRILAE